VPRPLPINRPARLSRRSVESAPYRSYSIDRLPRSAMERLVLVGRTLAHYKITAAIGAGGMGEVYRATDTTLGREIALKVLPPGMAQDPERLARFRREARSVAALNHPNIVTLHSVEEADGFLFLTMELVEGRPLNRLIPKSGFSVERIVKIASAIAEAMAAAHAKGIVHRDLKPSNVMVTPEERVKVLDFGLAKEMHAAHASDATLTSAECTKVGDVVGTPSYMSPEQVAGRSIGTGTDIFSFGVLLYEMSAGQPPFQGHSPAELASAILRDTPRPIGELRADVPNGLSLLIQCCLEKDAALRYQSMGVLIADLRGIRSGFETGQAVDGRPANPERQRADTRSSRSEARVGFGRGPVRHSVIGLHTVFPDAFAPIFFSREGGQPRRVRRLRARQS
jgi:serine/threonine protein kinase